MTTSTNLLDYIPQGLLAARPADPTATPGTHPDAISFYYATDGGLAAYINAGWIAIPSGSDTASGTNTGDQMITLTGNVTGSGTGTFAATIANGAVTLAKMADMATASVIYRKTAGSGAPEVNTLATLKTDLALATVASSGSATDLGSGTLAAARMPALTGDVTTSAGAVTTTLATVNSNVGSFGSSALIPVVTVNAKGLVTAVSTAAVQAGLTTGQVLMFGMGAFSK